MIIPPRSIATPAKTRGRIDYARIQEPMHKRLSREAAEAARALAERARAAAVQGDRELADDLQAQAAAKSREADHLLGKHL